MNSSTRLHAWFNLRPGEERSTSLMLLHSFFMGTATVFFETAASALFLAQFDASSLPFIYLVAAGASIATGLTYTRLKDRLAFTPLMIGTLGSLLLLVCLARLGLSAFPAGWLIFSMMIAYRLVSILTDLEYWALAARLYDVQQSKRLYSLIGSGEVSARILGAFSVPLLVPVLGVVNLLWLSALGLAGCVVIFAVIVQSFPDVSGKGGNAGQSSTVWRSSLRALWGNRYLQLIFALALCAVLGKYFVDFAFLTQMQTRWHAVESLASFFGIFSGVTQILNLLIRVSLSGRVLSRFGVGVGLLVLPVAHALCTLAIVAVASIPSAMFWLVIANQGLYKTLKHPIDNPSFKILYQPLPRRERLATQIAVEVIVTPLAIALAATLMLVFSAFSASSSAAFGYLMLANFTAWCVAAIFAFREYGSALLRALEKRTLDRTSFSIEDEKSIALIRSKLASEYPVDVIFALDLLRRVDATSLPRHWDELLSHSSPEVRRYVLLQIERSRSDSLAIAVGRLVSQEETPRVKAAALRALGALGDPMRQVARYLRHPNRMVEKGALIGLLQQQRESSDDVIRAQARLEELSVSADARDRVLAGNVLAETSWHETSSMLLALLDDEDLEVRRAALETAGKRGDPEILERVITLLESPQCRADATRALLEAGDRSAPLLAAAVVRATLSASVRARIARIAGRMSSFDRADELWQAYESGDEHVRQEALRALSARGYVRRPGESAAIVGRIEREVADAAWELGLLRDVGDDAGFASLADSLREEVEQSRERILLLLSFLYDPRTMLSAKEHLESASKEKRAYAAEILEVTLSQELKELTLPILERLSVAERLQRLDRRFPQERRERHALLHTLLTRGNGKIRNWTRACAVYGAARSSTDGLEAELSLLANDASTVVAETSRWALESNGNSSGSQSMLTIEKVILLKGVGMFSATSEDILADVATILEEVELHPRELVFSKGDPGDSMYIVVHGRVRVFDGDKTINFLGEREIFGELALLDPEPRSASVEAVEETMLFRLDRETLFELMADNIGVVSGIMQVLCRRLRRMTAIATGDK